MRPPPDTADAARGSTPGYSLPALPGSDPGPAPLDLPSDDLPPRPKPPRPHPSVARGLANLCVIVLCGFVLFRVGLAEPFGVPTGSMAPTLIGNHRQMPCTRCGYPVRVGMPVAGERAGHYADIPCPNCGQRNTLAAAPAVNGDRVMVDKLVYALRRPRRWEVAVFRCAADQFKAYVKRILGLPGEEITIVDGEVYADGVLLRKALAEVRETQIPVFDLAFAPPGGWGPRWFVYPADADLRLPAAVANQPAPATDSVLVNGQLVLDADVADGTRAAVADDQLVRVLLPERHRLGADRLDDHARTDHEQPAPHHRGGSAHAR